jgi:hypothetical protein
MLVLAKLSFLSFYAGITFRGNTGGVIKIEDLELWITGGGTRGPKGTLWCPVRVDAPPKPFRTSDTVSPSPLAHLLIYPKKLRL